MTKGWIMLIAILALGLGSPVRGQGQTVIAVVGAAGTPEYATQFARRTEAWGRACAEGDATFTAIGLNEGESPSDRVRLEEALAHYSQAPAEALWLILIGHGTFDGREAKFNLRGPDVSADDLARWLQPVSGPVAIINTASSSAPFLKALSAPSRVVVTATKSGFEQNYARFGGFLAQAITAPEADLDKDGQTSLLEAFLSASHQVDQFYAAAGRLATEHALLDDNGDTLGTPANWFRGIRPVRRARDGAPLDGYRAHQFHLRYSATEAALPPELRARRDEIELEVMKWRDAKDEVAEDVYFQRLEDLLREMAQIYDKTDMTDKKP